jgi:hypothetical protein
MVLDRKKIITRSGIAASGGSRTGCAGWLGERLDVGWAIDVLHPLATRE